MFCEGQSWAHFKRPVAALGRLTNTDRLADAIVVSSYEPDPRSASVKGQSKTEVSKARHHDSRFGIPEQRLPPSGSPKGTIAPSVTPEFPTLRGLVRRRLRRLARSCTENAPASEGIRGDWKGHRSEGALCGWSGPDRSAADGRGHQTPARPRYRSDAPAELAPAGPAPSCRSRRLGVLLPARAFRTRLV